jgi:molybdopterin synthase catalytic subunit
VTQQAKISIQQETFDLAQEMQSLAQGRADVGAIVTFTGLCRDENAALSALELEHYPGMAEEEIARVVSKAQARWPLLGVTVIHRYGRMAPGDQIVLVITASSHRLAAFESAEFLMDYLKTRAPFWKKEHRSDGTSGDWVSAKDHDDHAAARWEQT